MIDAMKIKNIKTELKDINDTDLKVMFGTTILSSIVRESMTELQFNEVLNKLYAYYEYDVPVCIGDVISMNGEDYAVTCVYTDNSVDLLSCTDNSKKINTGLYNIPVSKISKLTCIEV